MKLPYRKLIVSNILIILLLLMAGCQSDQDNKKFMEISKGLAKSLNELQTEPGITLTGFASDPDQKLFKIGIGIDHKLITTADFKKIMESYLENAASYTTEHDPLKLLKPYNLRIEEIGKDTIEFPLLADKFSGSMELSWAEISKTH